MASFFISTNISLEDAERRHILRVLQKSGWRLAGQGGAAEILGVKRTTLQSKMKKLGIRRPARFGSKSRRGRVLNRRNTLVF